MSMHNVIVYIKISEKSYLLRRVDSCTFTIFIISAVDLLNSCNRAAINKAIIQKKI